MEVQNKRSMRQHCALKHGIFKEFLAEFLGTFVLVVSILFFQDETLKHQTLHLLTLEVPVIPSADLIVLFQFD